MPVTSWTPQNVLRPIVAGFKPAAIQTKNLAKAFAPRRTGRMARAVRLDFTGPLAGVIHARGVPYIFPVTKGSKPHRITPRDGGAIAGDGFGPVEHADHPGHSGNPFLNRAVGAFPSLYAAMVRRGMRLTR